eukprot:gnl/TRDRNA2_/TRDRNA2_86135_c0_seq2.p1 gnl/TRDRNA2_/TRDRNA2_86135_c0~~gnl/TRDRNA2_/TRDRNA2_86135_c0_seq2.p1  ORF type:complete len:616 (-),score=148.39 gnl/TRDRNA2_/TRDRNA2_86135_c0_seq2:85-1932(-)
MSFLESWNQFQQQWTEQNEQLLKQGVIALGLAPKEEEIEESELTGDTLARRFVTEACALKDASRGSPGLSSADMDGTLQRWLARLEAEGSAGEDALDILLQSKALNILLMALSRSEVGRAEVRSAASGEESYSEPGTQSRTRTLWKILVRASAAPVDVLRQLLHLLVDVADEMSQKTGKESDMMELQLQWVLALLSAVISDVSEAALQKDARPMQAVESTLEDVARIEREHRSKPPEPDSAPEPIKEGSEVWAEWSGDGRWYRATVTSTGDEEVEVQWQAPTEEAEPDSDEEDKKKDSELLVVATGCTTESSRLPLTSVLSVDLDRPTPFVTIGEDCWGQQLDAAEELSRNFRKLQGMCEELTKPPATVVGSEATEKALGSTARSLEALRTANSPKPAADTPKAADEASKEREALRARTAELECQRAELVAQLRAVDKELAEVKTAQRELNKRTGNTNSEYSERTSAASVEVEAVLASRTQKAAALAKGMTELGSRLPAVAAACLASERLRRRFLEELLNGFHAAIWGPENEKLMRNPKRVAACREHITRAGQLVEQAWREMVQLAADTLDDKNALAASSEDISRAGKRYKKMRQELQKNLSQLSKAEAAPQQDK